MTWPQTRFRVELDGRRDASHKHHAMPRLPGKRAPGAAMAVSRPLRVSSLRAVRVWVTVSAIPTRHLRAGPAEFREICAAYFGAPSPVASSRPSPNAFSMIVVSAAR